MGKDNWSDNPFVRRFAHQDALNTIRDAVERTTEKVLRSQHHASDEIIFTKDKDLTRTIAGKQFRYSFVGRKKRLELFEILKDIDKYIPAKELKEYLNSPSLEALRKIIQSINKEVGSRLKVKGNLIEGRRGFGYKINRDITIITE